MHGKHLVLVYPVNHLQLYWQAKWHDMAYLCWKCR